MDGSLIVHVLRQEQASAHHTSCSDEPQQVLILQPYLQHKTLFDLSNNRANNNIQHRTFFVSLSCVPEADSAAQTKTQDARADRSAQWPNFGPQLA